MKIKFYLILAFSMCLLTTITFAQQTENKPQKALWNETMSYRYVRSISDQIKNGTFIKAEAVSDRKMLGELDHPKSGVTELNRVSHVVTLLEK